MIQGDSYGAGHSQRAVPVSSYPSAPYFLVATVIVPRLRKVAGAPSPESH
jgi:hypothetical protein